MITGIIIATACVAVTGLLIGIFLGVAGEKYKVYVDEKEEAVLAALPGNNCGGCGFAGCSGLAAAIAKGEAPVNACPVGGEAVGSKVSEIMGVQADSTEKVAAYVKCQGDCEKAGTNYDYEGAASCVMQKFVPAGGPKKCSYGCLGGGDCVAACPFDAIHIINGIAKVDTESCKACGKCVAACPKGIIELIPVKAPLVVSCSSKDRGPVAMKACTAACIGCMLCQKNCPAGAITVTDNLASIDYAKCTGCNTCVEKCPKKAIVSK